MIRKTRIRRDNTMWHARNLHHNMPQLTDWLIVSHDTQDNWQSCYCIHIPVTYLFTLSFIWKKDFCGPTRLALGSISTELSSDFVTRGRITGASNQWTTHAHEATDCSYVSQFGSARLLAVCNFRVGSQITTTCTRFKQSKRNSLCVVKTDLHIMWIS